MAPSLSRYRPGIWLTKRGTVTVLFILLAVGMGWRYGARSLNAVAAPLLIALIAGMLVVLRGSFADASLASIRPGFPGEKRRLELSIEGGGLALVSLELPAGASEESLNRMVSLPETIEHETALDTRGEYEITGGTVRFRGPLGLVERTTNLELEGSLVVYPERYDLDLDVSSFLFLEEFEAERQEFDRLREYEQGDPLKHIDWKSSAKYDDLYVIEYDASESRKTIEIAGSSAREMDDEMAATVGTVALMALNAGFDVGVSVPAGTLPPGSGPTHRENLFRLLARTADGRSPMDTDEADIVVQAGARVFRDAERKTKIRIANQEYELAAIKRGFDDPTLGVEQASQDTTAKPTDKANTEPVTTDGGWAGSTDTGQQTIRDPREGDR